MSEPVHPDLRAILDARAGRAHSDTGPVMAALREILQRHREILREAGWSPPSTSRLDPSGVGGARDSGQTESTVEADGRAARPAPYLHFDGMTWPHPGDPLDVEWTLRYGMSSPERLRVAALMIAAYKQLVADPVRHRNAKVSGIRRAMAEPDD